MQKNMIPLHPGKYNGLNSSAKTVIGDKSVGATKLCLLYNCALSCGYV